MKQEHPQIDPAARLYGQLAELLAHAETIQGRLHVAWFALTEAGDNPNLRQPAIDLLGEIEQVELERLIDGIREISNALDS